MPTVTLKGNPVPVKGDLPAIDTSAENFRYVKADLSEGSLSELGDKVKVILAVPSLDTGVCAIETKKFNEKLADKLGVTALVISKDLPFAMNRFCETNAIENVTSGSDFRYNEFSQTYNTEMTDGPLKGLSSRAVFVVDQNNQIRYTELVPEITQEPDYESAMKAIDDLL